MATFILRLDVKNISTNDYVKLNDGLKKQNILPHKRNGREREGEFIIHGEFPLHVVMNTVSEAVTAETGKKFPFTVMKDK